MSLGEWSFNQQKWRKGTCSEKCSRVRPGANTHCPVCFKHLFSCLNHVFQAHILFTFLLFFLQFMWLHSPWCPGQQKVAVLLQLLFHSFGHPPGLSIVQEPLVALMSQLIFTEQTWQESGTVVRSVVPRVRCLHSNSSCVIFLYVSWVNDFKLSFFICQLNLYQPQNLL